MPAEQMKIRSSLTPMRIGQIFQTVLEKRGVRFEPLTHGGNPIAAMGPQPELSVVASHDKNIGAWAIQLIVHRDGDGSAVEMNVVYHSGLRRAWSGTSNTYSRSAGSSRAQLVLDAFNREDPRLRIL
ncbi:hypothetical protein [Phytomonospora endophytica]|uniref:Uncharacterized protein n=1 Tax=Phytomonospora endophytica TaxID=714109 RepID=A0A841FFF1_9ACTN|nr:hypothetical protein [Phytomonospora endophytica]MBB6034996.1 hypothetical protein [Phytomonospora endophytica]